MVKRRQIIRPTIVQSGQRVRMSCSECNDYGILDLESLSVREAAILIGRYRVAHEHIDEIKD